MQTRGFRKRSGDGMEGERLDEVDRRTGRAPRGGMPSGRAIVVAMLASIAIVAVAVGLLVLFGVHHHVLDLLRWLDGRGWQALLLFVLIMALVMMMLVPGVLFTTGAGFVFGVVQGSIAVVIGSTLGAVAAFLMARHLLGPRAQAWLQGRATFDAFGQELGAEGWKIVALTRMVPLFPFKISNYLFGLTPITLRAFTMGTFVGVIPWSVHNVYLGAIAADLSGLGLDAERGPAEWALYIAGFLATVATLFYVNRMARRALARSQAHGR